MKAQHGGARVERKSYTDPVALALGQRIRARRVARGWTLKQLAEATELQANHIGHIESALNRGFPNTHTLAVLAAALGATMDELWHGPQAAPQPVISALGG